MSATYSNLLIDNLPKTVTIGGAEFEINSDFRTSLLFEMLMDDNTVPDEDKGLQALRLYFPVIPRNQELVKEAIEQILWFYRCGKEPNDYMRRKQEKQAETGQRQNKIYDVNYDDDYIYAAFIQQYGINLNYVEYMHWWEFRALFKSLTNETEFVKIMEYRGMEISKDLTQEQKSFYKKMKAIYALPQPKEETERMRAIEAALLGNGNVSGLL